VQSREECILEYALANDLRQWQGEQDHHNAHGCQEGRAEVENEVDEDENDGEDGPLHVLSRNLLHLDLHYIL